jgi:hypothetical protein
MEKLKIQIPNEKICQKVYDKGIELGYHHFRNEEGSLKAKTVFFDPDGEMTVMVIPPEIIFSGLLLQDVKDFMSTYPEVSAEEFLKE